MLKFKRFLTVKLAFVTFRGVALKLIAKKKTVLVHTNNYEFNGVSMVI